MKGSLYMSHRCKYTCSMSMYVISGHSMAETLTVALRVAEEAIEEAITKAEEFSDSLVRRPSVLLLLPLTLSITSLLFRMSSLLLIPLFPIPSFYVTDFDFPSPLGSLLLSVSSLFMSVSVG